MFFHFRPGIFGAHTALPPCSARSRGPKFVLTNLYSIFMIQHFEIDYVPVAKLPPFSVALPELK